MSWRDRILPASFRGVAFYVDTIDKAGGRTVVVHEFPQREEPILEDTGRQPRRISVEAYVVGEDYDLELATLFETCERRPAAYPITVTGTLILPNMGRMQAACSSIRTLQDSRSGRWAKLRLEFVLEGKQPIAKKAVSVTGKLSAASSTATAAASSAAATGIKVAGVPSVVSEQNATALTELGKKLATLDVFTGPAKDVAATSKRISALISQASALATSPVELVVAVQQAIAGIKASTQNAWAALYAYEALLASPSSTASSISPASTVGALQKANADVIAQVVATSAIAGAVNAAGAITWPSLEDALAVRSRLLAYIATAIATATSAEFEALVKLKSAIVASIPAPGVSLPRIRTIELQSSIPSILLAYRLFGDLSKEADIVDRNAISRPLFLPAGIELEVLTDA